MVQTFWSSKCWDYLGIDSLTEKKFSEKNSHHWFVHLTLEIIQARYTPKKWSWYPKILSNYISLFEKKTGRTSYKTSFCFCCFHMGVSENRGYLQIIHFNRVFHYKPSILGYPIFGNIHIQPFVFFLPHISPLLSLLGHDSKGCAGICMRSLVFLGTVGYMATQWTKTLVVTGPPLIGEGFFG